MEQYTPLTTKKEMHWQTLFLSLGLATLIFLPFVLGDSGYFLFYGDFNVQQIPFYQMCHNAVRNGDIFWNWNTDLGVNFIGSYSFYLLGSPFFWFTLLFPNAVVPYLMAPLLVIKFGLAAFTAYFYIRRFTHAPKTAMLVSMLYAFSGFSVYNVFFNHFHEAIIFFPLLLLGLELFITEHRKGVFALAVFICALSNYFFFFGMVVFTIIYWIIRTCGKCYKQNVGRFFLMLFEAALGVLMAAVILVPSFLSVIQNSRISSIPYGWSALTYGKEQIYLNIIQCFFFPPDIPARPVFFTGAEVKWSSLGGWLPLFSMTGVIAFMQAKKGHWIKRLICISAFMALVPILNSTFYMLNSAYYARWFYMPILIMCVGTALAIDDRSIDWNSAFRWTFIITFVTSAVIGLFPSEVTDGKVTKWGLFTDPTSKTYLVRYWVTCVIALLGLVILKSLLSTLRTKRAQFFNSAIAMVAVISVVYSIFFIFCGKQHSHTDKVMVEQLIQGEIDLGQDKETFRIDVYDGVDNTGMFLDLYSINAFHSIVPGSVTDFYEFVGEERSVASRPTTDTDAIRSLLSVKYLLNNNLTGEDFEDEKGGTKMSNFSYYKTENDFTIYSNDNYIPMGFAYDYYMTKEQCERFGENHREDMLLKAILLDEKQIEKYSNILDSIEKSEEYNKIYSEDGEQDYSLEGYYFSEDAVREDCRELAQNASYNFKRSNKGFSCTIDLKKQNLVFFSVPYEEGWTAYVNGKEATVEKVNVGFMAVLADSGVNEIEFVYTTPGLKLGVYISVLAIVVFIAYFVLGRVYDKKKGVNAEYPEGEQLKALYEQYDIDDAHELELEDMKEDLYFGSEKEETDNDSEEFSLKYRTQLGGFQIDDSFLKEEDDDIGEEE